MEKETQKIDPNYEHAHKLMQFQFDGFANITALYQSKRADILQKVKNQDLTQKIGDAQIAELAKDVDNSAKAKMVLIDRCEKLLMEQLHSGRELREEALDKKDVFKLKNLFLEVPEIQAMIDKHQAENNFTMLRLLKKHCLDNSIKVNPFSLKDGAAQFAEFIETTKQPFQYMRAYLQNWNNEKGRTPYRVLRFDGYLERVLPETLPPISLSKYWAK